VTRTDADKHAAMVEVQRMHAAMLERLPRETVRAILDWSEEVLRSGGSANHRRIRVARTRDLPGLADALADTCEWLWTALDGPEPDPVGKYWTVTAAFTPKVDLRVLRELELRKGYLDPAMAYRVGVDAAARMYAANTRVLYLTLVAE
jgi:hypothetical protein